MRDKWTPETLQYIVRNLIIAADGGIRGSVFVLTL
jgi:hypothetical protein